MGSVLEWATAVAALIAAVAGVAVWWNQRFAVGWAFKESDRGHSRVVNTGSTTAKRVRVRIGSLSNPDDKDATEEVDRLDPNEELPIMYTPTYGGPKDLAVVVTWRQFGWTRTWKWRAY
jgi:hypothetical protein